MNKELLHLNKAVKNTFAQLNGVLGQISNEDYSKPSKTLFNATIGQHVRHIIELFIELNNGYDCGVVNYEKRKRDYKIETDINFASNLINTILKSINKNDKTLILEAGFNSDNEEKIAIQTNYYRELAYNIEHTIHHMALIKVGLSDLSMIETDKNFGIASATIKYRKACVQ